MVAPAVIAVLLSVVTDFVIPVLFLIFQFILALIIWKIIKSSFLDYDNG